MLRAASCTVPSYHSENNFQTSKIEKRHRKDCASNELQIGRCALDFKFANGNNIYFYLYTLSVFSCCLIKIFNIIAEQKNCMVCGIDVYHSGVGGGAKKSVAGFVASLDTQLTKWHSRVCMQASKQELVDMLQVCLASAITAFQKVINVNYVSSECNVG